ncbi:hypothetical protein EDB81DRAFT_763092 [Dactylonectria macrodidyma]|uniref:NAD-dependent epimerase/dehydratase domain-containing protein n=1 Tax=Dactylonectria macrodidyma TaxID=307937 RepID=A0A9P9EA09_9HYPO|nr:hypothetical protein EDB81DRAFT_763092 [Dactylonectria macrodidyma]
MVELFLTGGTGYIGGDALYTVINAHPEYEITALARSPERGEILTKRYPSLRLVYGDLEDSALLAEESAKADIICHLSNCEHVASAQAIADGARQASPNKQATTVIHLSGSDLLVFENLDNETYGVTSDKVFDDWEGLQEIISIKDTAPHKEVDAVVLELGTDASNSTAKTAIVCPPTIYGRGRGPGNQRSIQVPELAAHILKRGSGFQVEGGKNRWATVHIHDLSQLFLNLVEDAASGRWKATWGSEGFYFAENGTISYGDVASWITTEAWNQGFLKSTDVESVVWKDADKIWDYASLFWGTNSLTKAVRARQVLDWVPRGPSVADEIRGLVTEEAKALGVKK